MIQFIPAKINIGLNIVEKRPDGYHNLETVFYPIGRFNGTPAVPYPFGDVLEITPSKTTDHTFTFTGRTIDCPLEKNLVVTALRLFEKQYNEKYGLEMPKFDITLDKHIPDGAGIGGGSADATYMLRGLNTLCDNPFDLNELSEMALHLGADCPFFLLDEPAYGEGVGEILTPIKVDLKEKWLLLAKPDIYISTAEAFREILPKHPETSLKELIQLPIQEWRHHIVNDFEESLSGRFPEIINLKQMLYNSGAEYASMSGSGSSVYGIYRNREEALHALTAIRFCGTPLPFATLIKL
ncbi:MAG: 4-(cytidine 5'-diphospho)-2-C-methyl-D-erythritol kinase [Muribaculaceae bacterium]|nr:4-(cytidine 5'-diphospho)-2-C-methyl-D-erythritol kinase [Muribaculaceae bacterium]